MRKAIMFFSKKYRYIILLLLVFLTSFQFAYSVYQKKDMLFSRGYEKSYKDWENIYNNSQYVKKNVDFIPDEYFEMFAAGAFLKGLNPILIVHDHPPLGRYMLSASIIFFDNPKAIIVFLLVLSLVGIFLLSKLILKENILAFIPVLLFTNEPLFLNKLVYIPLPEPIQFPFIVFSFYFFIQAVQRKQIRWFMFTAFCLGIVISTRFFITGAAMVTSMYLYLFLWRRTDKKAFLLFTISLPLSLLVLLGAYTKTIMEGYSPLQIISIQRYILDYHKSKFVLPFSFWDLFMFNRWHTWWGDFKISSDPQWILFWPFSMVLTGVNILVSFIKKLRFSEGEKILSIWVFLYCLMLSTGYTSTRYFLPLVPFLYILATAFVCKVAQYYLFREKISSKSSSRR